VWGRVPRERLRDLLDCPFRGGTGGDVEMNHAAPMVGQNHKNKEDTKVHHRHHKEIRRDQLLQVTVEERTPRMGRWFSVTLQYLATAA
jgi:hypothetical protein